MMGLDYLGNWIQFSYHLKPKAILLLLLLFCVVFFEIEFLYEALVVLPGTCSVDQAGLELRDLPAFASPSKFWD